MVHDDVRRLPVAKAIGIQLLLDTPCSARDLQAPGKQPLDAHPTVDRVHHGVADAVEMPLQFIFGNICQLVSSEEHTSQLQSLMRISYVVFFFKKKINTS